MQICMKYPSWTSIVTFIDESDRPLEMLGLVGRCFHRLCWEANFCEITFIAVHEFTKKWDANELIRDGMRPITN